MHGVYRAAGLIVGVDTLSSPTSGVGSNDDDLLVRLRDIKERLNTMAHDAAVRGGATHALLGAEVQDAIEGAGLLIVALEDMDTHTSRLMQSSVDVLDTWARETALRIEHVPVREAQLLEWIAATADVSRPGR